MLPAQMSTINCCFEVPGSQGCVGETCQNPPPPQKNHLNYKNNISAQKNIPAHVERSVVSRIRDFSMSFYLDVLCIYLSFGGNQGLKRTDTKCSLKVNYLQPKAGHFFYSCLTISPFPEHFSSSFFAGFKTEELSCRCPPSPEGKPLVLLHFLI